MSNDPRNLAFRRLFARAIDQLLFMFLVHWIVGADEFEPLLATALILAFVPIDTVLTWLFGMTLGKLIFRIRVVARSGNPIGFWQAFERSIRVWFFGQAAGIGVLMPFTTGVIYNRYIERGVTSWDDAVGTQVELINAVEGRQQNHSAE